MRLISFLATILCLTIAMVGCGEQKPKSSLPEETTTSGIITICVDETLMPIIQEEIELFEGLYPKANIIPRFTTETEAFNELFSDSVKLIVATRSLTEEEINAFKARKIFPKISKIATDGVALITNRANPDSLVTMEQLHDIFTGKITSWKQLNKKSRMGELEVVFDNTASSTVRYVVENICKGDSLQGNIKARKDNEGVIEYVSQVPNAIGVIGSNWIGNDADSTNLSFDDRIQVMLISNDPLAFNGNSYQPFQAYIAMQLYPLCRDIYMICNSPRQSLAFGFASFVGSEKGQRIILKSGILPANVPMRVVNVRDNL